MRHAQKIIGILAAMRNFAGQLAARGHRVRYLKIDAADNRQSLPANLDRFTATERDALVFRAQAVLADVSWL